ncbi:large conductance mechanosensitive channel protein MscL [Nonomuraea africana]|uniref:Large-conductance mechanosensitive channel n=1 Tax=Nonomuraea africana TaxID=46171 RepID=A0ABR9KNH5_9ACTN|nr:large conductance mechanosensitive channel protein MscL [Nonomuraea africana]MBE1563568.1 large conductance mechanosensitive channel [Nonomuraea africana]
MSGFKKFLMQGNVIDLAVAVVIGAAFGAIVTSFVADLLTPLISAFGGLPDFSSLTLTVGEAQFKYGNFLNALVSFLIIAAVVYFLIIKPYTHFKEAREEKEEATHRECPACLSEIPKAASRCSHCCVEVAPV